MIVLCLISVNTMSIITILSALISNSHKFTADSIPGLPPGADQPVLDLDPNPPNESIPTNIKSCIAA